MPYVVLSRAQGAGVRSSSFSPDGIKRYHLANEKRYNGAAQRLLLEPSRKNYVTNSAPASWTSIGATPPIAILFNQFAGPDVLVNMARFTWAGGAPNNVGVRIPTANLNGLSCACSVYLHMLDRGGITSITADVGDGAFSPSLLSQVVDDATVKLTVNNVAGGAQSRTDYTFFGYDGTLLDFYIGYAQTEVGDGYSTYIPTNGVADATRGADLAHVPLSGVFIAPTGAGAFAADVALRHQMATNQIIWQIDDGTDNNRFIVRNGISTLNIEALSVVGGVATAPVVVGTRPATSMAPFNLQTLLYGDGRAKVIVDEGLGGAPVMVTGLPTVGLTTMRLGCNVAGGEHMAGEIGALTAVPYARNSVLLSETGDALLTEAGHLLLIE